LPLQKTTDYQPLQEAFQLKEHFQQKVKNISVFMASANVVSFFPTAYFVVMR
jgi:hypothetical protein